MNAVIQLNLIFVMVIIQIFIFTCYGGISELPSQVPGIRVISRSSYSRQSVNLQCNDKTGFVCHDDCKTWMACVGQSTPIHSDTCENISTSTPYCVNNKCVSQPDTSNALCGSAFQCTSNGIFPNPNDCTVYHYCSDVNAVATLYRCPSGYNFNSLTKLCQKGIPCQKVNCANKLNKFVLYTANPAYYAFCGNPTYMFKCVDDVNYAFDLASNSCSFNCKSVGNFVDRFDCTKYVICDRVGGKFNVTSQDCPSGYYFNKTQCVQGNCDSEITTVAPTVAPEL